MGKTMFVKRKTENLVKQTQQKNKITKDDVLVTISVHDIEVCTDDIVKKLCQYEEKHSDRTISRIYHFDIAPLVSIFINLD